MPTVAGKQFRRVPDILLKESVKVYIIVIGVYVVYIVAVYIRQDGFLLHVCTGGCRYVQEDFGNDEGTVLLIEDKSCMVLFSFRNVENRLIKSSDKERYFFAISFP